MRIFGTVNDGLGGFIFEILELRFCVSHVVVNAMVLHILCVEGVCISAGAGQPRRLCRALHL